MTYNDIRRINETAEPGGIPYRWTLFRTVQSIADDAQVCVATDLECFKSGRLCELLDEFARTSHQSRIVINLGGEYPRMIVRPENAGRLCTYYSRGPRCSAWPTGIHEGIRSGFE